MLKEQSEENESNSELDDEKEKQDCFEREMKNKEKVKKLQKKSLDAASKISEI